jgi:hypothetical protein
MIQVDSAPAGDSRRANTTLGDLDLSILKLPKNRARPVVIDLKAGGAGGGKMKRGREEIEVSEGDEYFGEGEEEGAPGERRMGKGTHWRGVGDTQDGVPKPSVGDLSVPEGLNVRACIGAAGRGDLDAMAVSAEWFLFGEVTNVYEISMLTTMCT